MKTLDENEILAIYTYYEIFLLLFFPSYYYLKFEVSFSLTNHKLSIRYINTKLLFCTLNLPNNCPLSNPKHDLKST